MEAIGSRLSWGLQTVDHLRGADLADVERLERDVEGADIGGPVAAGIGIHVLDGGIGLDDLDHLQERVVDEREGCVLRPLHAAGDGAGVLLREEAFGNFDDDGEVQGDGERQDNEHEGRMIENPAKRAAIERKHSVEESFTDPVGAVVLAFFLGFQKVGAHGGSGGQGDEPWRRRWRRKA